MAKPTHHSALESMGFKLAGVQSAGSGSGNSVVARHHYTLTRNNPGLSPITHHVIVDDFMAKPDKYSVAYYVTQNQRPYSDASMDRLVNHKSISGGGSSDPIRDIIDYHRAVSNALDHRNIPAPDLRSVTPENVHSLVPGMDSWTPWSESPSRGFRTQLKKVPSPSGLTSFNSAPVKPLDIEVHRRLTSGSDGSPRFTYHGRFPGEDGIDMYHATHKDPQNPNTFQYDFTVRHNPSMKDQFSYNAKRRQSGLNDDLTEDRGSFLDVTGDSSPVANFGTLNQLIRRHNDVLRALNIMSPSRQRKSSALETDWDILDRADEDLRPW